MIEHRDLSYIRDQFPITRRCIYFDSARQTPLAAPVRAEVARFLSESETCAGPKKVWLSRAERVREKMGRFINADPAHVVFTRNTSDSVRIAIDELRLSRGDEILLDVEGHPNILALVEDMMLDGIVTRFFHPARGLSAALEEAQGRACAAVLSLVDHRNGERRDVAGLAAFCREHDVALIVDAVQAIGTLPIDVDVLGAPAMAFGCSKGLLTLPGLGVLVQAKDFPAFCAARREPAGASRTPTRQASLDAVGQPARHERGLQNLPAILALGAALDLIDAVGIETIADHLLGLGDVLIAKMDALHIHLHGARERETRSNIYLLDLPGQGWLRYLEDNQVRVSQERSGIRVSFALFNTTDEVEALAHLIRSR